MLRWLWFNLAYFSRPIWDTGISPPELVDFIAQHAPGRALDLGCGTGTNAITLANHGWKVTGVDFSWRAIQIAEKKAQKNAVQVDFHVEDVTRLKSVTGKFNLILDIGCFHSLTISQRKLYIENLKRLLCEDGTYLAYMFMKADPNMIGPGVTDSDVQGLVETFHLVNRKDSTERGMRPSVWLTLIKKT